MDRQSATDVLTGLPHAAILVDRGGNVVAVNPAALAHYPKIRTGEHITFGLRDPALLDALAALWSSQKPRRIAIVERVPIERVIDMHIAMAGAAHAMIVIEDLSERRKIERMRVDFIANASHELRTPLASLMGFLETIKGPAKSDPAAQQHFLGIMETQALRMSRLVDDLLSLSRVEMREHIRPRDPVEINAVIRQIMDALGPLAREKNVTMTYTSARDPAVVPGDRDELLRVFENLLENAIKYGADGGKIDIGLSTSADSHVQVDVEDYGTGIAPEHLPRLTERFFRADAAASRETGGTGLGLAIVKHITARHRGRLEIDSRLGKGSRFSVSLETMRE